MPRRPRRVFTEDEIRRLRTYSALRLPVGTIATLLNISVTELRYTKKRDENVRRAVEEGQASSTAKSFQTLFRLATGRTIPKTITYTKPDGKEVVETYDAYIEKPHFPALQMWLNTQEKMEKPVQKIELSGPEGSSIESRNMTKEELKARVLQLRKMNDLTEDE